MDGDRFRLEGLPAVHWREVGVRKAPEIALAARALRRRRQAVSRLQFRAVARKAAGLGSVDEVTGLARFSRSEWGLSCAGAGALNRHQTE